MDNPRVHLNKLNQMIEKIELPDGTITKRIYGNLPDLMVLAPYEEKVYELYDNSGNKIKLCRLLSVTQYRIRYDVVEDYTMSGD